jgi:hypothetical protein
MLLRRMDSISKLVGKIFTDRIVISHRKILPVKLLNVVMIVVMIFFKVFFVLKYIKIILFYILKFIFNINTLNRFKNTKK